MFTLLAPLALYAATCALLLAIASRWLRPLSRWAALALALVPLTFTAPAMLTGRVLAPVDLAFETEPLSGFRDDFGIRSVSLGLYSDVAYQMIPWRKAVLYALEQGEWPLWNPFLGTGDPLAGSAQPAPYSPPHLLSLLLPLPQSFGFLSTLTLFLATLGAFLLARQLGCRDLAALVSAAGWTLGSFLTFWLGWPLGLATAYFPFVLLGGALVVREPGWRAVTLLCTALTALLLAGHPETALHVLAGALLYTAYEAWRARPQHPWRCLLAGGGAGVAALGLSALFLLPFADALHQTAEYHERKGHYAEMDRSAPLAQALENVVSQLFPHGYAAGGEPGVAVPFPHFFPGTAYGGGLLLALALFGLIASRERSRWFWLGLGLFGLIAGCNFPIVADAVAKLPLFDITLNERLVFYFAMAIALLAGLGVEAWLAAPRPGQMASVLAVTACALGLGTVLYWPFLASHGKAEETLTARTLWQLAPPLLLAIAAGWARARPWHFAQLVLLTLVVGRAGENRFLVATVPGTSFYPRVAPLDRLPTDGLPYRIVGQGYTLVPNTATLYELEDVRGHQAVLFKRYKDLLPFWGIHQPASFTRVLDLSDPFLSFLNARYALVARDVPAPQGWSRIGRGRRCFLLRNERALERAFVPPRVRLGGDSATVLAEIEAETDFARRAWIETAPPAGAGPATSAEPVGQANGPGTVIPRKHRLGYRLDVDMQRAGWIVVSVPAWRGWRARANGEELPTAFANHAFLGIRAPRGRSTIELEFRPRSFKLGLAISSATAGLLLAIALGARWRTMRRRAR